MKFTSANYLKKHVDIINNLDINNIDRILSIIAYTFKSNKKIFTCGNGGSATTASHFITDWNKMVYLNTGLVLKGYSLTDNIGLITAWSNDFDYSRCFSGQLESLAEEGDLLVAISVSGNSKNVIEATKLANLKRCTTISLTGFDGGELIKLSNYSFHVDSNDMQLCEDVHLMFGHLVMKHLSNLEIIV